MLVADKESRSGAWRRNISAWKFVCVRLLWLKDKNGNKPLETHRWVYGLTISCSSARSPSSRPTSFCRKVRPDISGPFRLNDGDCKARKHDCQHKIRRRSFRVLLSHRPESSIGCSGSWGEGQLTGSVCQPNNFWLKRFYHRGVFRAAQRQQEKRCFLDSCHENALNRLVSSRSLTQYWKWPVR